ncbi:MAG TPA: tryptophan synthase subunit alpha [Chitinophagaceae bacterium]|jgi:tryptophan synthase alpha chain|nr:tryptophan synthase subunit alpha [Chitinophagaceae bacterium]
MSRLQSLFERKPGRVLNIYCTAGFPERNSTRTVMRALQEGGADLIEIGVPYSDPLADGPVIQASGAQAIRNGMTVALLFQQLEDFRSEIHVPVVLMGYINQVLQYGFEPFCRKAAALGIDGFIFPDLPLYEYENEFGPIIRKYGLDFIFLVTPETSEERIRKCDALSTGFLYAVSSSSTTGSEKSLQDSEAYFGKLKSMQLRNPVLIGFNVRDKASFDTACRYANGAIIGSAYIRALQNASDVEMATKTFLRSILEGEPQKMNA